MHPHPCGVQSTLCRDGKGKAALAVGGKGQKDGTKLPELTKSGLPRKKPGPKPGSKKSGPKTGSKNKPSADKANKDGTQADGYDQRFAVLRR